jgi:hypothetical protein
VKLVSRVNQALVAKWVHKVSLAFLAALDLLARMALTAKRAPLVPSAFAVWMAIEARLGFEEHQVELDQLVPLDCEEKLAQKACRASRAELAFVETLVLREREAILVLKVLAAGPALLALTARTARTVPMARLVLVEIQACRASVAWVDLLALKG